MLLGKSLVWISFLASLLSLASYLLVFRGGESRFRTAARWAHGVAALALAAAAAHLMALILGHRFEFAYVAHYSSRDLPLHFLVSSFWAGQEGTFLLWAFFSAILGLIVIRTAKEFEAGVMTFLLPLQGFLGLLLLKLTPFQVTPITPPDGVGLNPLLQDTWMVIHPPVLFLGFAACAVPAAFAMSGMVLRDASRWARASLPWTAFAVLALGAGIYLGGYWAYRTLGWGGYWGWDPVENSSLVPWLVGVALLHGLLAQSKLGLMNRLNSFLAVTAFILVLYSTFLTRSGVLGDFSVHSFVDLGINRYLVAFVGLYVVLGFGLCLWRLPRMGGPRFSGGLLTREYGLFLATLAVVLYSALVLLGTSAPLLTRLAEKPSNVSVAYYRIISLPFALILSLLLAVGPLLVWSPRRGEPLVRSLALPAALSFVAAAILFALGIRSPQHLLLCFLAAMAFFVNVRVLGQAVRRGVLRTGGPLVHLGLALMLIGMVASTAYDRSETIGLPRGETVVALGHRLLWKGEHPAGGGDRLAYNIEVTGPDGRTRTGSPVMFFSAYNRQTMRRPAILRSVGSDLYLSPHGIEQDEALDRMDKEILTMAVGDSTTVGGGTLRFEALVPGAMNEIREEATAVLTWTSRGQTERLEPQVTATAEGQQYREALAASDGTKIVMRQLDLMAGKARFYVRQFGSAGYDEPTEVMILDVAVKPLILVLWIGSIVSLLGLGVSVLNRRRRAAQNAAPGAGVAAARA